MTPLLAAAVAFAYVGGSAFVAAAVVLSVRRRRLHPLLLVCVSAVSFSWLEAPYDWAVYAQFPPEIPRMPSWWPLNMTWGGLPAPVPPGYVAFFALPAAVAAAVGNRLHRRFSWRRPPVLLVAGLVVGCTWAFLFNAIVGARLGVFRYGRVIPGLALWEGTRYQYPLYDAVAMGVQTMGFAYLLGRTDPAGRSVIQVWADRRVKQPVRSSLLAVLTAIVAGHLLYASVFAPHLATKLAGEVTSGPAQQLFPGVPNQPLHGR